MNQQQVAPPPTNRGVQNTLSASIDWFEVTYGTQTELSEVLDTLGGDFVLMPRGLYGYRSQLVRGNVRVLYDGGKDMGIHVIASGQGCRELEEMGVVQDWRGFLADEMEKGALPTRIDIALDEKEGLIDLDEVERCILRGEVVSRFRDGDPREKRRLKDGVSLGKTIYFGSAGSDVRVRMYDKAAEQGVSGHHTRVELQCRSDRAVILAFQIFDGGLDRAVSGVLKNYLDFRIKGSDSNRSRWQSYAWWDTFLSGVGKLSLVIQRAARKTLSDKLEWVKRQVGPTLALLTFAAGGDLTPLLDILSEAKGRLRPHQLALLGV